MKRILIWGTGKIAEQVMRRHMKAEVIGFIETVKHKERYKDKPVYGYKNIPGGYDYIIVATVYSNEIYETILNSDIDIEKVIFMIPSPHTINNFKPEIRDILGEENYTVYAAAYHKLENTFFEDDMRKYNEMNKRKEFAIQEKYMFPRISDKYGINSGMDAYFWQDLWAAKHIISEGIKEHFDIGSRVDGFIAHLLAAGIKVKMIDVRPFPGEAENLETIVDDATELRQFEDGSISSLSALCSLEHFGLGRYGDPVDPEACFRCFERIARKLKKGGRLWISVPVGKDHVEFNAHRVFTASTIINCLSELELIEYSVITAEGIDKNVDIHKYDQATDWRITGLFYFRKI